MHLDDKSDAPEADFPEFGSLEADINLDSDAAPDFDSVVNVDSESDALFEAASTPSPREPEIVIDEEPQAAPVSETVVREISLDDSKEERPVAQQEKVSSFSWTAFLGGFAALGWLAAAIGVPVSYFGLEALAAMHPAMQAGLVAIAFGPTILIWLGSAAVAEAAKAGKLASELTKIARDAMLPLANSNDAAKRITLSVRTEIADLNKAVDQAFARLSALQCASAQHARLFEETINAASSGSDVLTQNLKTERDAFAELNADLKGQTETLAHTIGRQVRLMREASKLVKTELGDAEETLETHLSSFRATASVIAESTAELNEAAQAASAASGRLDETLGSALDTLCEATKLTDAARQSTELAVHAANSTANAVRETTQRAISDAKRVAELIREETDAMQHAAASTLATLREAADAARVASEDAQQAADKHASSIEKRLSALASTAGAKRPAPKAEKQTTSLHEAAARISEKPAVRAKMSGLASWNNVMPPKAQIIEAPAEEELVSFAPSADQRLVQDVYDLVADAGVLLEDTLQGRDLESVAAASRQGAVARRRAVLDAEGIAVTRLARFIRRDQGAKDIAQAFRGRPDLAKADRATGGSNVIRAYLLVDAALG